MIEYTSPEVLANSPDPADPLTIEDWPDRIARALIPYELDVNGRPMAPECVNLNQVPVHFGRNGLWLWGENPMADALVTCTYAGRRWVLLVQRKDDGTWAMPGGSIEPGETPFRAAMRECMEETGLDLAPFVARDRSIGIPDPARWVPDPRGSMEAWAVTVVVRFDLGELDALPEVRGADDARDARWFSIEECSLRGPAVFPAHREILAGVR